MNWYGGTPPNAWELNHPDVDRAETNNLATKHPPSRPPPEW